MRKSSEHSKWNDGPQNPEPKRTAIWPWFVLAFIVLGAIGLRMAIVPRQTRAIGATHPAVGTKVEVLDIVPLTGDGPHLAAPDLPGKVTLINFWGPWCGPCGVEFPHLVEIEQHFRGVADFRLISIAYPGGPGGEATLADETAQFLAQQQASFPTYADPQGLTASHLAAVAKLRGFVFPTTVVLGRDGTIAGLWTGYRSGDERQVQQVVATALRMSPQTP